ncbi:unnamed protein product [Rotaria sordida]|uniref:7-dehydrocholesterol reductase n=1 Tax=Rotaria sordida TaxID=392033 RepID=A0A813VLB6_9BILA|nr:unnamed protein product [Rotaria sordida]
MSLYRRPIRRIVISAKTGLLINKTTLKSFSQQNIYAQLEETHLNTEQPQFIGEERQDDAIFKIYLKRVRHKSSTLVDSSSTINTLVDDTNEQHETTGDNHNNDRGTLLYSTIKVYQLKACTLEKIIEHLTNDTGELDTTNMHILFSTYRTFTNTRTLIDTLITRYRAVLPASLDMTEDVRQKTLNEIQTESLHVAITCFLNSCKEDFYHPPRYSILNHFIKHIPDRDLQKQGQTLLEEFKTDEETIKLNNNNNNNLKTNFLYNEKGFDYIKPWNILEMSSTMIAEQLTIVDADLLKRVLPYECLTIPTGGCSRRALNNNSNRILSTIDKTIEYFNAVVARVVATILKEQDEQNRAHVIEKWIDVAHQCRKLKNFSSLTAILNGLLSGCIYRLNTAWSHVKQDYQSILEELKNVFGSCADRKQARAILDKQLDEVRLMQPEYTECAAKYTHVTTAINATLGRKYRHKMARDQQKLTMLGTVPYLGLYLSDLTYIDSAYPNTIIIEDDNSPSCTSSKKLINFEKHRKQFEVLAQIKLFQSAANAYTTLHPLPRFKAWFDNVRIYNDTESWELSYQIEPKEIIDNSQSQEQLLQNHGSPSLKSTSERFPSEVSLEPRVISNNNENNGSMVISSTSLKSSSSSTSLDKMSTISNNSLRQQQQLRKDKNSHIYHSRSSSASSFLTSSNGSSSQGHLSATASPKINTGNSTSNSSENEAIIAKVHFAGNNDLLYKKVRINNNERTTSVLKTILDKFGLDPSTYDQYCIEQQLPDRKILILDHCNVFYALARSSDDEQVELIVREKTRQERQQKCNNPLSGGAGHNRTPSGFSTSSIHSPTITNSEYPITSIQYLKTTMTDYNDEKLRKKSLSKKNDSESLLENDRTHQLSIHTRQGHNKVLSESILPLILCLACPFFVRSIVFICDHCNGSIIEFLQRLLFDQTMTLKDVLEDFFYFQWHWPSAIIILSVFTYAIIMTMLLPGDEYSGPITDTGHVPIYRNNGFSYYIVSLVIFALLTVILKLNNLSPTYIYDHWKEFLSTVNTFAFLLCFLVMIKGKYMPSTDDHRSSSNWLTDFYRGVELYPRIFNIDIKLITNCRYGMLTWALLSVIFCMKTFELYGYTDSALVTCILTLVYLTKFFWWESGYMKTIDIIVDRGGFYLCWGCLVWVSGIYTLPSYFLVKHPNQLGFTLTSITLLLGILSIYVNYDCDRQKIDVRSKHGECLIWGKPAEIIRAKYRLLNGKECESILLASGYWSLSRHFHYIPELALAFLWTCPCGFKYILPYFYFIILFVLLMHRAHRDDQKCTLKYGQTWVKYCHLVPWKVWPRIY